MDTLQEVDVSFTFFLKFKQTHSITVLCTVVVIQEFQRLKQTHSITVLHTVVDKQRVLQYYAQL